MICIFEMDTNNALSRHYNADEPFSSYGSFKDVTLTVRGMTTA